MNDLLEDQLRDDLSDGHYELISHPSSAMSDHSDLDDPTNTDDSESVDSFGEEISADTRAGESSETPETSSTATLVGNGFIEDPDDTDSDWSTEAGTGSEVLGGEGAPTAPESSVASYLRKTSPLHFEAANVGQPALASESNTLLSSSLAESTAEVQLATPSLIGTTTKAHDGVPCAGDEPYDFTLFQYLPRRTRFAGKGLGVVYSGDNDLREKIVKKMCEAATMTVTAPPPPPFDMKRYIAALSSFGPRSTLPPGEILSKNGAVTLDNLVDFAIFVHEDLNSESHSWLQSRKVADRGLPVLDLFQGSLDELGVWKSARPMSGLRGGVNTFLATDAHQINRHLANLLASTESYSTNNEPSLFEKGFKLKTEIGHSVHTVATCRLALMPKFKSRALHATNRGANALGVTPAQFLVGISLIFLFIFAPLAQMASLKSASTAKATADASLADNVAKVNTTVPTVASSKIHSSVMNAGLSSPTISSVITPTTISVSSTSISDRMNEFRQLKDLESKKTPCMQFFTYAGSGQIIVGLKWFPRKWHPTNQSVNITQGDREVSWMPDADRHRVYWLIISPVSGCEAVNIKLKVDRKNVKHFAVIPPNCNAIQEGVKSKAIALVAGKALAVHSATKQLMLRSNTALEQVSKKLQRSSKDMVVHQSTADLVKKIRKCHASNTTTMVTEPVKFEQKPESPLGTWAVLMKRSARTLANSTRNHCSHAAAHVGRQVIHFNGKMQAKLSHLQANLKTGKESIKSEMKTMQSKLVSSLDMQPRLPASVKTARDRARALTRKATDLTRKEYKWGIGESSPKEKDQETVVVVVERPSRKLLGKARYVERQRQKVVKKSKTLDVSPKQDKYSQKPSTGRDLLFIVLGILRGERLPWLQH